MQGRTVFLIFVIIILFSSFAIELKYIEDSFNDAAMTNSERCTAICKEQGKTGYIIEGYCNCRVPVSFSKHWICFWNVTPGVEKAISIQRRGEGPSKRIPIYPSNMFKEKTDPDSVRNIAVGAISKYPRPNDITSKIFGIYKYVADRTSYVSDPIGEEYIAWPNETLKA